MDNLVKSSKKQLFLQIKKRGFLLKFHVLKIDYLARTCYVHVHINNFATVFRFNQQ